MLNAGQEAYSNMLLNAADFTLRPGVVSPYCWTDNFCPAAKQTLTIRPRRTPSPSTRGSIA